MKDLKIMPGISINCPECLQEQGVCTQKPFHGAHVSDTVKTCFTGFTSKDPPICKCGGVFYRPSLGFFTRKYGWTW